MNKIGRMQKRIIGCITDSASSTTSPLQFISNLASDRLEHPMMAMVMVTIVWNKIFPQSLHWLHIKHRTEGKWEMMMVIISRPWWRQSNKQILAPVVKALDLVAEKSCGSQGITNTVSIKGNTPCS